MKGQKTNRVKISVENLRFYYGKVLALEIEDFQLLSHHISALIGPSGCGKSTFLRVLNRMNDLIEDTKVEGKVFIDEEDIYSPQVDVVNLRKKVGMVFQSPNPFPKSIFDNVSYGPRVHGLKDKKKLMEIVEKSLRQAALWEEVKDRLGKPALGLSGGQQQRLCIARVLAVQPDIILMDEPTSALDPIATLRIEELVQDLKDEYTIIIVTHNLSQAARISDYTAFFLHGQIVEWGATDEIFTNPREEKTEDYITGRFG
ncbi:MAG: phosphate ABC transporter ATP-binding protein [Candidatus Syntrophonatronum acetioxidans]|uniref:Phosphate ABC transporter ATP-binding protein n=1 Tax=Candidatus Syntrophonatronum acetioxidans TaxID=1795816 RepID=A0A424YFD5_9FIRM|nr:MAG: phosphate ABC transporter ATP-binding protein [Candidatus Syntrophonatronum acetioxidans]